MAQEREKLKEFTNFPNLNLNMDCNCDAMATQNVENECHPETNICNCSNHFPSIIGYNTSHIS